MNEDENAFWRGFEARLERVEDIVRDLDAILRGDRRSKTIGLLAEQDRHDQELRKLNAVVFMDSTGKHGLAHDVDVLMERRSGQERRTELRWGFWTAIIVALISSGAAVLTNLDKIKNLFPVEHLGIVEQKIEKARHPKGKKIYRYRIVPPPEAVPEKAPSEDIKESPSK